MSLLTSSFVATPTNFSFTTRVDVSQSTCTNFKHHISFTSTIFPAQRSRLLSFDNSTRTITMTAATTTSTKLSSYKPTLKIYPSKDELAPSLGSHVLDIATASIQSHDSFNIAIAGGSLPTVLGKGLLQSQQKPGSFYAKWNVILIDERVVPWENEDSNSRLIWEEVMDKVGMDKNRLVGIDSGLKPEDCAKDYEKKFKNRAGEEGRIDLALMGIGPDGHCASLFPKHPLVSFFLFRFLQRLERVLLGYQNFLFVFCPLVCGVSPGTNNVSRDFSLAT